MRTIAIPRRRSQAGISKKRYVSTPCASMTVVVNNTIHSININLFADDFINLYRMIAITLMINASRKLRR